MVSREVIPCFSEARSQFRVLRIGDSRIFKHFGNLGLGYDAKARSTVSPMSV